MKETNEMNLKEYKEYFFKSPYFNSLKFKKVLTLFWVAQWKFTKHSYGWSYKYRINPYNPLTYLVLLTILPFVIFSPKELLSSFKWH